MTRRSMSPLTRHTGAVATLCGTIALLALFAGSFRAHAQSAEQLKPYQRLPGSVTLGPRLLDYRIDCTGPNTCRVQCFQHGVKVFDRDHINESDQLRMLASSSIEDEIIPRWIEIRSANGSETQTVLLSLDTTCDLKSLVISPNARP